MDKAIIQIENSVIYLKGSWLWSTINELDIVEFSKKINNIANIAINGNNISQLDTIGIYFIHNLIEILQKNKIKIVNITLKNQELFHQITSNIDSAKHENTAKSRFTILSNIGYKISIFNQELVNFIIFLGQVIVNFGKIIINPSQLQLNQVVKTINDAGIKGLWVAGLLCFLIGATLAYEMAPQFVTYGANVYIVNLLGISLLKEIAPLITAVIVSGRTGSAIAAEIGIMKVQEELDAMHTMGISPIMRLVIPKILGLVLVLPLITSITDVISMLGGAVIANNFLGIDYTLFLQRLQTYVPIENYTSGIYKSFAFAFSIALIGCYSGLQTQSNATSVGAQTTKSVVLGIISIVLIDAIFAVLL